MKIWGPKSGSLSFLNSPCLSVSPSINHQVLLIYLPKCFPSSAAFLGASASPYI